MTTASGKNNEYILRLEKQIRQAQAITASSKQLLKANALIDGALGESTALARASAQLVPQSENLRTIRSGVGAFLGIQSSLTEKLNLAYPAELLEHITMVSQATRISKNDSVIALRAAALTSQFDTQYLSEIELPQAHFISERVSNLIKNFYCDIESDYPVEAGDIKGAAEALELVYPKSSSENFSLVHAIAALSLLISIIALYYDMTDHYGNKKFQEQLLSSQTEILGQMYELSSHIALALPAEPEAQSDMTEYVVVRAVNLRTEYHTGKGSHVITTLMPNQKVELLKQAEHPNKKWIYVGYRDNIEGIPRTGWVYKKYLKRLER
ncbi:hypothetical protein DFP83_11318 [Idiomarina fontislapidosi]|uniref:Uncharacterized protein n=1 Tax=Idiomarina fontislapidosi TaxID=263723 RepID=A0A432XR22_9GAMM|nr:SH3 domain-containing protein [Idiomarina fontislapidosi]PYE30820.1 hypothetical protein DFP83_11318 [Idiomarina fontislapidosi]RUO51185.1 hypothetical protein CWE25_11540 [Idiomarina fontislapidosi]